MQLTPSQRHSAAEPAREKIMAEVRRALWDYNDLVLLSSCTGISLSCLHALRSGRTAWPRPTTLFTILPYLGLEMRLVRADEWVTWTT